MAEPTLILDNLTLLSLQSFPSPLPSPSPSPTTHRVPSYPHPPPANPNTTDSSDPASTASNHNNNDSDDSLPSLDVNSTSLYNFLGLPPPSPSPIHPSALDTSISFAQPGEHTQLEGVEEEDKENTRPHSPSPTPSPSPRKPIVRYSQVPLSPVRPTSPSLNLGLGLASLVVPDNSGIAVGVGGNGAKASSTPKRIRVAERGETPPSSFSLRGRGKVRRSGSGSGGKRGGKSAGGGNTKMAASTPRSARSRTTTSPAALPAPVASPSLSARPARPSAPSRNSIGPNGAWPADASFLSSSYSSRPSLGSGRRRSSAELSAWAATAEFGELLALPSPLGSTADSGERSYTSSGGQGRSGRASVGSVATAGGGEGRGGGVSVSVGWQREVAEEIVRLSLSRSFAAGPAASQTQAHGAAGRAARRSTSPAQAARPPPTKRKGITSNPSSPTASPSPTPTTPSHPSLPSPAPAPRAAAPAPASACAPAQVRPAPNTPSRPRWADFLFPSTAPLPPGSPFPTTPSPSSSSRSSGSPPFASPASPGSPAGATSPTSPTPPGAPSARRGRWSLGRKPKTRSAPQPPPHAPPTRTESTKQQEKEKEKEREARAQADALKRGKYVHRAVSGPAVFGGRPTVRLVSGSGPGAWSGGGVGGLVGVAGQGRSVSAPLALPLRSASASSRSTPPHEGEKKAKQAQQQGSASQPNPLSLLSPPPPLLPSGGELAPPARPEGARSRNSWSSSGSSGVTWGLGSSSSLPRAHTYLPSHGQGSQRSEGHGQQPGLEVEQEQSASEVLERPSRELSYPSGWLSPLSAGALLAVPRPAITAPPAGEGASSGDGEGGAAGKEGERRPRRASVRDVLLPRPVLLLSPAEPAIPERAMLASPGSSEQGTRGRPVSLSGLSTGERSISHGSRLSLPPPVRPGSQVSFAGQSTGRPASRASRVSCASLPPTRPTSRLSLASLSELVVARQSLDRRSGMLNRPFRDTATGGLETVEDSRLYAPGAEAASSGGVRSDLRGEQEEGEEESWEVREAKRRKRLFWLGVLVFPAWWLGSLPARPPSNGLFDEEKTVHANLEGGYAGTASGLAVQNTAAGGRPAGKEQLEWRVWQGRCRAAAAISVFVAVGVLVLVLVFVLH